MKNKELKKLIKDFEREHQKVYEEDGCGCDCGIVYNQCHTISSKEDWLGTEEKWKKAKKEKKELDKTIRCYVCEFIKNIREIVEDE